MIRLTQNDWRIFRRLQRKHKVSTEFLRYNLENIQKFIWYETWPRIVIKRYAIRKGQRVFIVYYRLRRVLFDQSNRRLFKRMRQNIRQWSKRMVAYQKNHHGICEYVEEIEYEEKKETEKEMVEQEAPQAPNTDDVSKKLKEQLELLKNGRRQQPLIINSEETEQTAEVSDKSDKEKDKQVEELNKKLCTKPTQTTDSSKIDDVRKQLKEQLENIKNQRDKVVKLDKSNAMPDEDNQIVERRSPQSPKEWQINLESTPEKQITTQENTQPIKQLATDEKTEKSHTGDDILPKAQQTEKLKTGLNFLDMLMCKVAAGQTTSNTVTTSNTTNQDKTLLKSVSSSSLFRDEQDHHEHSMDSTDGFLGFDDCERIPGMLMTPIVPLSTRNDKNSAFVSESLNEYMRVNDLETNYSIDEDKSVTKSKIFARDVEGLMTPKTKPPYFDMPAVPENLLKFRTVAERKQYLQKFSKNYRLSIINNEASIYRDLQRRMRLQKVKSVSQQMAQSSNSSMSFTRNGWKSASFINTEFNKYYYQKLCVDYGSDEVRLMGARGNNEEFHKKPYTSKVIKPSKECRPHCLDDTIWQDLKPIKSVSPKKLNSAPLPAVFKPCPLSYKPLQKPLDDDTAALLLAGGSMAVVRMPTVELEVFPEQGKPLHEIAKRYLQYILPHHDISREWAEFSVSTLQKPHKTLKEVEQAAAKRFNPLDLRKSYTFLIPYLNDRNHILVRRVVDRSEKLDQSFEKCLEDSELVPKTDFTFRQNLDETDDVLLTCADVVGDMINTVAISCSENSFIKPDPDGVCKDGADVKNVLAVLKQDRSVGRPPSVSASSDTLGPVKKSIKKTSSLLKELRRLNATIIDAAVKPGIDKIPCSKDYCSMGCICVSLSGEQPMRQHCGKTKCMLECSCKSSNQSRIMRLETDGRTITTEDAFMLRRKATARLARMEKEFTSTVVLTENETLLINETNNDKKRRCTKAPKRYEDSADTEDERRISPKKTAAASALTTIDNEKNLAVEVKEIREPVYVEESILEQLKHCTVNLVQLQDMDNVATWCMVHNLYKCFCKGRAVEGKPMIIEKEEVNTTTEHADGEQQMQIEYTANVKAKYTFDKVEKRKKSRDEEDDDNDEEEEEDYPEDDNEEDNDWKVKQKKFKKRENKEKLVEHSRPLVINEAEGDNNIQQMKSDEDIEESIEDECDTDPVVEKSRIEKVKPKRSLQEVRTRFYLSRPECCRRQIPIPRRMFLYCNRKRRLNVLKFIKNHENERTRVLLNEHVMRSVYYHKIDADNQKKTEDSTNLPTTNPEELDKLPPANLLTTNTSTTATDNTRRKYLLANEVVDLLGDEDEDDQQQNTGNIDIEENTQLSSSTTKSCTSFDQLLPEDNVTNNTTSQLQTSNNSGVITVKKFATLSGVNMGNPNIIPANNDITDTAPAESGESLLKLPKISSCFSLNVQANIQKPLVTPLNEQQNLDFTSATTVHSAAFSKSSHPQQPHHSQNQLQSGATFSKDGSFAGLDMDNENVKDVYNSVIKTMNSLVSKKMQDIDFALKRESHIIPSPNADILCIMKWCNFLDAFCEGFAYIWQVKMKDVSYFVATIRNIMPMVAGAMGIVNITALKADKMPLMGKMLLQKMRNEETQRLAIVMQGKVSHWVVKGFLRSEPTMACNKPTPESHPSLTKKINVLCSLLVKQRQRDEKKKEKDEEKLANLKRKVAQIMPTPRATIPIPLNRNTPQALNLPQQIQNSAPLLNTPQLLKPPQHFSLPQLLNTPQNFNSPPLSNVPQVQNPPAPTQQPTFTNFGIQQNAPAATQKLTHNQPIDNSNFGFQQNFSAAAQTLLPNTPLMGNNSKDSLLLNSKSSSRKRKSSEPISNHGIKMDSYSKMNTNIEFRKVLQSDINEIHLPELHRKDHKWLVLDLQNDFSHIFVPEFRDLVSLDRIQKVINFAKLKNKIVKLQFFQNAPFDAFVTPKSGRKIYFGPLTMDMKPPTLILLQSVDGQMMLRELYQIQHNIKTQVEEKTKAFWLLQLKGQTHFEVDLKMNNKKSTEVEIAASSSGFSKEVATIANNNLPATIERCVEQNEPVNDDDDDDCMIIDECAENVVNSLIDPKERYNFTIESTDSVVGIIPQTNSLPGPPPIQTLKTPTEHKERFNFTTTSNNDSMIGLIPQTNILPDPPPPVHTLNTAMLNNTATVTSQSLLKLPNTNTVIKPLNPVTTQSVIQMPILSATSTTLPILTLPPNTVITGITPITTMENATTIPFMNLPTNAVITGITQAPQEAAYGSTIFISSSSGTASSSTTTSVNPISTKEDTNITNNKSLAAQITPEGKMLKPENPKKTSAIQAQITPEGKMLKPENPKKTSANTNFSAASIKRRRISIFCSNKYDKISENLAVDAVINKILPDNAENIQIDPLTSSVNETEIQTKELVSTIGSTTITKIPDTYTEGETKKRKYNIVDSSTAKTNKPIVFDVNFMDDGDDEPTASIVIKPTMTDSSKSHTSMEEPPLRAPIPPTRPIITSNTLIRVEPKTPTQQQLPVKNPNIISTNSYKMVRLPSTMPTTQSSSNYSSTATNTTTTTSTSGQTKILNKLLNSKSPLPTFSTPSKIRTILPRASLPCSTTQNSTSSRASLPSSTTQNSITSGFSLPSTTTLTSTTSRPSLPSTMTTSTTAVAPVPLKLPKIMSTTGGAVKMQTATQMITKTPTTQQSTTTTTNQQSPAATVAIKQVQEILNQPTIDLTNTRSSPTVTIKQVQDMLPKPTIDLTRNESHSTQTKQTTLPIIKATITPAQITKTPTSTSSFTTCTSATSTPTQTSDSSSMAIQPNTPSTSTLTISKVQSFGSPQKQINPLNTSVKSFNPPKQPQISNSDRLPPPPAHIQYGYIVSSAYITQKFVAKRVADEFYVKVPLVGIVKLQAVAVNNYLNKYMSKNSKESKNVTASWNFVAASKDVQMQNHQKSLLVRKAKPSAATTSAASTTGNPNKVITASSTDEPILIDD